MDFARLPAPSDVKMAVGERRWQNGQEKRWWHWEGRASPKSNKAACGIKESEKNREQRNGKSSWEQRRVRALTNDNYPTLMQPARRLVILCAVSGAALAVSSLARALQ